MNHLLTIDFPPVSNAINANFERGIIYFIDDAVISDANPPVVI